MTVVELISDVLEADHERVGKMLSNFLESMINGKPDIPLFNKARASLHNHIYWEESVLFRKIEHEDNSARIHGLEVEHAGIWKLLDKIESYFNEERLDLAIDRTEGLIRVLETHNITEESTVYRELESQDEAIQVRLILSDIEQATAPEGWVCRTLKKYQKG